MRQDFSRGLIAAGGGKQEGKRGKDRAERREGERERKKKQKSFQVRQLKPQHPALPALGGVKGWDPGRRQPLGEQRGRKEALVQLEERGEQQSGFPTPGSGAAQSQGQDLTILTLSPPAAPSCSQAETPRVQGAALGSEPSEQLGGVETLQRSYTWGGNSLQ